VDRSVLKAYETHRFEIIHRVLDDPGYLEKFMGWIKSYNEGEAALDIVRMLVTMMRETCKIAGLRSGLCRLYVFCWLICCSTDSVTSTWYMTSSSLGNLKYFIRHQTCRFGRSEAGYH